MRPLPCIPPPSTIPLFQDTLYCSSRPDLALLSPLYYSSLQHPVTTSPLVYFQPPFPHCITCSFTASASPLPFPYHFFPLTPNPSCRSTPHLTLHILLLYFYCTNICSSSPSSTPLYISPVLPHWAYSSILCFSYPSRFLQLPRNQWGPVH